ncbi:PREDICTED: TOM1-like protein 1 isoform X3 [Myotis brandtii]|uniref:TOM1-like protein 1 isoform X3 n=1 Tax=Myotis brandtii TaxID=109478 RepID=UPI000704498B|nr:PREDICTED: TOM1-like protein 1 isoform X3 [Myotis brandtii]
MISGRPAIFYSVVAQSQHNSVFFAEKATFAGVQTEDWGQFLHICDIINTASDGPKDAVKALKKRISKNYNHKEIELTLSTAQVSSNPPTSVPTAPALSSVIAPKNATITLVPEQIGKLHSELDMVKMNVKVMSAILMENIPGSENPEDMELLQKLYKTGREMQERIMDLLVVVENEDVTIELIQVNEDLNNAILGYERFTRNQQRILEQNNQREDTNAATEPSAPSCDLLDLSPSTPNHRATLEEVNAMNAQLSHLSFSSPTPVIMNSLQPSSRPQMDLLALENTDTAMFAQRTSQNPDSSHTYESLPVYQNSVLLQPVSLHTVPASPSNQTLPALPANHPAMTKNDLQLPNYYEVMEFDPLAPAVTTEAIYEEIDVHHRKGTQNHSDC